MPQYLRQIARTFPVFRLTERELKPVRLEGCRRVSRGQYVAVETFEPRLWRRNNGRRDQCGRIHTGGGGGGHGRRVGRTRTSENTAESSNVRHVIIESRHQHHARDNTDLYGKRERAKKGGFVVPPLSLCKGQTHRSTISRPLTGGCLNGLRFCLGVCFGEYPLGGFGFVVPFR